ncbi:MAG TPA: glycosyltransferase family 4 protein [Vicinamibacterales bacterium]|nr:glycosyltransferase family 4 protein [Vicinamibacterales bacterium]
MEIGGDVKTIPDPLWILVPGDLATRTGGYAYDRRVVAGLRERGWHVQLVRLDDSFPVPTAAARHEAADALAMVPDRGLVLVDGLAFGALPDEALAHAARLALVALVHHPLALETGLDPRHTEALHASERRALSAARHVVVTSRGTAATLARYDVTADRITVVEPGTDPAPLAQLHRTHAARADTEQPTAVAVTLLCVGTLTPRKGYELLLDALAAVPRDTWRLRCAGSTDRDPATTARVRERLHDRRLAGRVELIGDMDTSQLAVEYDRADVFVLATLHEGYGMVVAEALARGLPIVSTATGAIPDLVGADAGIVVAPGDVGALANALARVISDAPLRARLAAAARRVRDRLPTWTDTVANMARVLTQVRDAVNE